MVSSFTRKLLPKDFIYVTINIANQLRIFPTDAKEFEKLGFEERRKVTEKMLDRKGQRFLSITQLDHSDPRNTKRARNTHVIRKEHSGAKGFAIYVGTYSNLELTKYSKTPVEAWHVGPGCIELLMPHYFGEKGGVFMGRGVTDPTKHPSLQADDEDRWMEDARNEARGMVKRKLLTEEFQKMGLDGNEISEIISRHAK